jgi:hypothetical protein
VVQEVQAAPPVPQAVAISLVTQVLPLQHPLGHDVALHTHAPCALHCWPVVHPTHAPPETPQALLDDVTHVPLEQQPLQLVPPQVHAPPLHDWPDVHSPQASPADPHADVDCADGATQFPWLSQQPSGQEVGEHVHVPAAPQV